MRLTEEGLVVGASVTLTDLKDYITDLLTTLPPHTTGVLQALLNMLKWFAGPQIRNVSVSLSRELCTLFFIICCCICSLLVVILQMLAQYLI